MIEYYTQAVVHALEGLITLFTRLAMPLAVLLGLAAVAVGLTVTLQRDSVWLQQADWRRNRANLFGILATMFVLVGGWTCLHTALTLAQQDIQWREAAEATANPVPDAPAVTQFEPTAAVLAERTYQRTLTLPPDFLQRIGSDSVGALAPYLTDPSASNVLRLADTFRRSGKDVVFTRQMTRLDEEPVPFTTSQIHVSFRRLAGRAYDADFEGRYLFRNPRPQDITGRFLFPLPNDNTIRNLNVSVGGHAVMEPNASGEYEWRSVMHPGEQWEAVVRYHVVGARTWQYGLGSRRGRVQTFRLAATTGGAVTFLRGSLQPTAVSPDTLRWDLSNVVTTQRIALAFPPDIERREAYLQALSALPTSLVLFLIGAIAVAWRFRTKLSAGSLAVAIVLFTLGLWAAPVVANYLGAVAGLLITPLAGAFGAARLLDRRTLLAAFPAALLPTAFLSPTHSGLLVLILTISTLCALAWTVRTEPDRAT
ncbi:MAG: hypothetical protein JWL77_5106 [Chthonomonadaceae bacterium]|nr:hypothetical protein [Chthonomonadaceae bacterium]